MFDQLNNDVLGEIYEYLPLQLLILLQPTNFNQIEKHPEFSADHVIYASLDNKIKYSDETSIDTVLRHYLEKTKNKSLFIPVIEQTLNQDQLPLARQYLQMLKETGINPDILEDYASAIISGIQYKTAQDFAEKLGLVLTSVPSPLLIEAVILEVFLLGTGMNREQYIIQSHLLQTLGYDEFYKRIPLQDLSNIHRFILATVLVEHNPLNEHLSHLSPSFFQQHPHTLPYLYLLHLSDLDNLVQTNQLTRQYLLENFQPQYNINPSLHLYLYPQWETFPADFKQQILYK